MTSMGVGTVLALVLSTSAWAQVVMQSVTVRVNPGQMSTYLERVATLQGVMDRVGGGGRVQVWDAMLAGTASDNTLVAVSFPSLTAFAESTTKAQADPEWQKVAAGLDEIRTLVSQGLIVSRDGGAQPEPAATGSVLQGVLVRVNPGKLDAYLQQIEALKKVQQRLGTSGTTRVWQSTLGGEATGTVAVAIVHPSLAAFAENTTKLQADAEWQRIVGGLDSIRTVVSQSLFTAP
jgi:hypothetical protein